MLNNNENMMIVSVAHSEGTSAHNEEVNVNEYLCSQTMSLACADYLNTHGVRTIIIDAQKATLGQYKKMKKEFINKSRPELAIEIHLNSCDDKKVNYSSCFYNGANKRTRAYADRIISNFQLALFKKGPNRFESIGLPRDGYDQKRFWFIDDIDCDSMVIEPCFLSNNEQAEKLKDKNFLIAIGQLVAEGIIACKAVIG